MTPFEILLLALGLVATVGLFLVVRRAARVLPPERRAPALEAPPREAIPPAPVTEPEAAPHPEPVSPPEAMPAGPAPSLAPDAPAPAELAREVETPAAAPPLPAVPPPTRAPLRFAPPPRPGAAVPAPVVPPPEPAPVPPPAEPVAIPAPAVVVPLPLEKPRVPTPEERHSEEQRRYRAGLTRTRKGFVARLARLLRGKPRVDRALKDQIEEVLFTADIGPKTAEKLLARVTEVLDRREVADPDAVWAVIGEAALGILREAEAACPPPSYRPEPGPYVLLMMGVNGVGKTTTLGKLAARHQRDGRRVLLVAGDTFRAAASEQLDVWARRVGCEIHAGKEGADPSAIIFEGISRGKREGYEIVLCDTAGRLHTRKELMDELQKMGRAAAKALAKDRPEGTPSQPQEVLLCLDATIGQNALAQAQMFKETLPFTGLVLTKLDGTAKGGVVLGVCDELRIPIRHIGIGEGIDDLRDFDAEAFCEALFSRPDED